MSKAVAIISGGLDSTTLLYQLVDEGHEVHALSFNYGQRHSRELEYCAETCRKLNVRHDIIDLTGLTYLISNSALTSNITMGVDDGYGFLDVAASHRAIEVPDGHYAEETMKQTVVPNRNMIMLSIATGVAVNEGAEYVATGVHSGDHFIYPDCRPAFIEAANKALTIANEGFGAFADEVRYQASLGDREPFVFAPYLFWSKSDIAYKALMLNVPLAETWSCYKGEEVHCGRCGTCVERLEAIDIALGRWNEKQPIKYDQPIDGTKYADTEFWKEQIK